MVVPPFRRYYPSIEMMSRKQFIFYKKLSDCLDNGKYLDVQGSISYVFTYLYGVIERWRDNGYERLSDFLIHVSEIYKNESMLSAYCLLWAHDCLLGRGHFEEYLEKTEPKSPFGSSTHQSNLRLNIQRNIGVEANPIDVIRLNKERKSRFIEQHSGIYSEAVITVFANYSKIHGDWFNILRKWGGTKLRLASNHKHRLFNGVPSFDLPSVSIKSLPYYLSSDHMGIVSGLVKDAENIVRNTIGVPVVGEGWISETILFRRIEMEFTQTVVIQHGRPQWLGKQHFDVWLPNWKIAIEYHGEQHFRPIDFFGGITSFKETIIRDRRKVRLARRHGVKLFIVSEKDDPESVISEIREFGKMRMVLRPGRAHV